jgi:hypothetical protein
MTADDFRRLVLDVPGAVEGAHMGHPDFRANGRIFASLHSQDRYGMVKLQPEEQRELMRQYPGTFEPAAGAWGRQGCTNVRLESADRRGVKAAIALAWDAIMAKPAAKRRSTSKPAARSRRTATGR